MIIIFDAMRTIFAILLILPLAAFRLHGGAISTCPFGTGFSDGCSGANINGSVKIANFFTTYTGTNYSAHRPPWNVAGVDYPVGYDTTLTLLDPSVGGNLPACATYASHLVTVNSAPCTINGYDFSAQSCIGLQISNSVSNGSTITVTNNKFGYGTGCSGFSSAWVTLGGSDPSGANIIVSNNEFDGSHSAPFEEIIGKAFVGNLTSQYNAFFNTDKDTWHAAASTGTVLLRYNYGEGYQNGSGAHCQFTYINDGGASGHPSDVGNWLTEFNTGFLTSGSVCGTAVYSYATGGSGGSVIPTGVISNNTVATPFGGANRLIDIGFPSGSPNEINNLTVDSNYVAPGPAASGWLLVNGGTFVIGAGVCNGNVSMETGATQTGTFGSGANLLTCN